MNAAFPAVAEAGAPALGAPQLLLSEVDAWIEHALAENHELQLVQAFAERAGVVVERLGAERRPDPLVGNPHVLRAGAAPIT